MGARFILVTSIVVCLLCSRQCLGEDPLFEDDFNNGLSSKWQAVGLKTEDYRIRDGGLEWGFSPASGRVTRRWSR